MLAFLRKNIFFSLISGFLILFRIFLTSTIPLLDNTEARYSEVARLMNESNNWITLFADYNFPFLGKPPLSTWFTNLSFHIFGISEWSSRLPSLILSLGLIILLIMICKKRSLNFCLSLFVLLSLPQFFLQSGITSTDMSLVFFTTLALVSFWEGMRKRSYFYLFFIASGLAILSKGLIGLILILMPITLWLLLFKKTKMFLKKAPLMQGGFLTTLTCAPWYTLAEIKNPGFLEYFIIGEHFQRFLTPHWKGDLYGNPPYEPLGTIWLFLFLLFFPWIFVFFFKWIKNKKTYLKDPWLVFLTLCVLTPCLFFTLCRNIMPTYNSPGVIFLALFIASIWNQITFKKTLLSLSLIAPSLLLLSYFYLYPKGHLENIMRTDKKIISIYKDTKKESPIPLFYWKKKSYSSQFYNQKYIPVIKTLKELRSKTSQSFFIIVKKEENAHIPTSLQKKFALIVFAQNKYLYFFKKN